MSSKDRETTPTHHHRPGPIPLPSIRNLVFQGGSVKGTAYGGAVGGLLEAFGKEGLNFHTQILNVAGTSAGAITALALSMGTEPQELVDIYGKTDFRTFLDTKAYEIVSNMGSESNSSMPVSAAMSTIPLLTSSFGFSSGEGILEYLEDFAKLKTNISHLTFKEHHDLVEADREAAKRGDKDTGLKKDIFVVAYNLTLDTPQVFNHLHTPDSVISDAVRCSMSIPYVFVPHKNYVKKTSETGEITRIEASDDLYIDGGITDNYPIWVFDKLLDSRYEETLGFYLVTDEEKREIEGKVGEEEDKKFVKREIRNIMDYTKSVLETVISSQQTSAHKQSKDIARTLYIDHLNTNMMNFGLTVEEKNHLVNSGWNCACLRFNLLDELDKCKYTIQIEVKEEVADVKAEKRKEKKEKKEKEKREKKEKEKNNGGSGPPTPDLDSATDTGSPHKCRIV